MALVGLAAALVVGIRAVCAAAAVCDGVETKNVGCRGFFSKYKRRGERREICSGGESETDLFPLKGSRLIARLDLCRSRGLSRHYH